MKPVVVLLSGGLDSGTLLTQLSRNGYDCRPISFEYGQKHQAAEIQAAIDVATKLGVIKHHRIFNIETIFTDNRFPSALLPGSTEMPHMTYQEIAETVGPSPTYVPFRNGLFISIATSYALQIGADQVFIATHAEDARNWAYPDCTPEFNGPMAAAVYVGTYHEVRLVAPFQYLMKKDIVRVGIENYAPFELMWSCYEGGDFPCGKCPTCVERAEAFAANSFEDPATPRPIESDEE